MAMESALVVAFRVPSRPRSTPTVAAFSRGSSGAVRLLEDFPPVARQECRATSVSAVLSPRRRPLVDSAPGNELGTTGTAALSAADAHPAPIAAAIGQ